MNQNGLSGKKINKILYERGYLFGQRKNYNIAKQYGYLQKSTKGVSSLIELLKIITKNFKNILIGLTRRLDGRA